MPELPEVEALAEHLRTHALARPVARVDLASMTVLKTFDPPLSTLTGRLVTGAARHGKFLDLGARRAPPRRAPLARRAGCAGTTRRRPPRRSRARGRWSSGCTWRRSAGPGFDLTEAGTQKRLAVYLVEDPMQVPGVAKLGPDALSLDRASFGELLAGRSERLKTLIVDQQVLAGIGNAYSDEILHVAKLSPFASAGKLDAEAVDRLHAAMVGGAVRRGGARRRPGRRASQGREALGDAGARAHRAAVSRVRRHRPRGLVRRTVLPVLPHLPDPGSRVGGPPAVPSGQIAPCPPG